MQAHAAAVQVPIQIFLSKERSAQACWHKEFDASVFFVPADEMIISQCIFKSQTEGGSRK